MSNLPDFKSFCLDACMKLWGEPDKRSAKELRWNGADAYGARTFNPRKGVWYDADQHRGGSTLELVAYAKGEPRVEQLRGAAFIETWAEAHKMGLVPEPPPPPKSNVGNLPIIATYPYTDEQGALLFEVVRFDTTDPLERFRQRRPDGKGGWDWRTKGTRQVLYRLPELIAAVKAGERVLVCEGERDANTAARLSYPATTNPGGVEKWRKEYDTFFAGADVVIVSDNDSHGKGQAHAAKIAKRLDKVAAQVRTVIFPQKDLSEWADAGGTREALDALIDAAPNYTEQAERPESESEPVDADAVIEQLAKLTTVQYELQRKAAAEALDVRAGILDRLVKAKRSELGLDRGDDKLQGQPISFSEVEPWPEPVDGVRLLNELSHTIGSHIVMRKYARHTVAPWVLHTYLLDCFLVSPRLAVCSPMPQCGKTTFFDILNMLIYRPLSTANCTASVLFRVVAKYRPTVLVDEADTYLPENDELRGIINSGYRQGAVVLRTVGDNHEPRSFATFAALAIAGIGDLPDTIADRSVTLNLKRRLRKERITSFRPDRADHLTVLARKALRWTQDNAERVAACDPKMPDSIINRRADNWRALLTIAEVAGGRWPQRVKAAALQEQAARADDESSLVEMLLIDIKGIFEKRAENKVEPADRIPSGILTEALVAIEGRPWAELGRSRKPLTANGLARRLKALAITPDTIRMDERRTAKGYYFHRFKDAFARYLGAEGVSQPSQRNKADEMGTSEPSQSVTAESDVTVREFEKSNNDGLCYGVSVEKGRNEENAQDDRTCVQCRGPVDGREQLCAVGDASVWLHPDCQRFYLQRAYQ